MTTEQPVPDDTVLIFETTDAVMLKCVTKALGDARVAHEVCFDRPTLMQYGPKKPPRRVVVAADVEAHARQIVDAAAGRRQRVVDAEAESQRYRRYASPSRNVGGGDAGFFIDASGGGDCGDRGGCGD